MMVFKQFGVGIMATEDNSKPVGKVDTSNLRFCLKPNQSVRVTVTNYIFGDRDNYFYTYHNTGDDMKKHSSKLIKV